MKILEQVSKSLASQFEKINEILKNASSILIASHERPDSDAVGSVLALYHFFQERNKKTICYLPTFPSAGLSFLPGFFELRSSFNSLPPALNFWFGDEDFDIAFCLDYGDFKRLRLSPDIEEEKVVTIDHHLESDQRGKIKIIEPKLSSTSEIIYLWLKSQQPSFFSREIATCLLTGIVSDTGGFSHICTSAQTLQIASELFLAGAPLNKIFRYAFTLNKPQTGLRIWGRVFSRLKKDQKSGVVYSWLSFKDLEEYQAGPADLARISSLLSTVAEANLSLFLVEQRPGEIEGSLRSEKGGVDKIARTLGGGGHTYAAGFHQEGTIETVLKKVLKLLE